MIFVFMYIGISFSDITIQHFSTKSITQIQYRGVQFKLSLKCRLFLFLRFGRIVKSQMTENIRTTLVFGRVSVHWNISLETSHKLLHSSKKLKMMFLIRKSFSLHSFISQKKCIKTFLTCWKRPRKHLDCMMTLELMTQVQ